MFLHLKKCLGDLRYDDNDEVKRTVLQWVTNQVADIYEKGFKNWLYDMISALILAEIMYKNRLWYRLSYKNNIGNKTLLVSFLFPNYILFKNIPHSLTLVIENQ